MKARSLYILIALACVLGACSRDEANLFDKSAAERSQEALDNANKVLLGATNGWECLYFANTESRGYNLMLDFRKDGSVKAATKNSLTTANKLQVDSNSVWEVTYDYGPILTFNTYNSVLHAWADPRSDGDGYLGDYEFLVLSATPERVVLKGKKHSGYTILRPMPEMDLETYFDQCNAQLAKYFGNGNILTLQQDTNFYYLHEGSNGLFNVTKPGEKAKEEDPILYPLCPTLDGFAMSYGFNDLRNERIFIFDSTRFVGEQGSVISAGDLYQMFTTYIDVNKGWTADIETSTGVFADKANAFEATLKQRTGDQTAKLNMVAITYSDTAFRYTGTDLIRLRFKYKQNKKTVTVTLNYAINLTTKDNTVAIAYNKPLDAASTNYYETEENIKGIVDALTETSFALESVDAFNPAQGLKLFNDQNTIVVSGSSSLK